MKLVYPAIVAISACLTALLILSPSAFADSQASPIGPIATPFDVAAQGNYTISADLPDPTFHKLETKSYPGPANGGILSNDPTAWTGFLRQSGRTMIVNLNQPSTVTGISINFLEDTSRGIIFPTSVHFSLSTDGIHWMNAGVVTNTQLPEVGGPQQKTYSVTVPRVTASFIRVSFPVDVWVMAQNLQVTGSPFIQPSLVNLPAVSQNNNIAGFLGVNTPQAAGIQNMLLIYSGAYGALGTWKESDFLPNVAYVSPSGQVQGKMFDTFLFLPYGNLLGSALGWQNYLKNLFAPEEQLSALNQTVADLQPTFSSLGISEPTVNVVLAIPYPNSSVTNFGGIPGYSSSLSFSTQNTSVTSAYGNRQAAISWYVNQLLADFQQANFTHLRLAGLYWDSESVNYSIPHEADLVQSTANLVHSDNLKFYWIPSFDAPGLVAWQDFGFDGAIEQANYIGNPKLGITRVTQAADQAQEFGLGMEVELYQKMLTKPLYQTRYFNELVELYKQGAESGVVHAFYAGSKITSDLANSTNPSLRQLYVDTYDFLIGMFTYQQFQK